MTRRDHERARGTAGLDSEFVEMADGAGALDVLARVTNELAPPPALRERVLALADPQRRLSGFVDRVAALFDLPTARAAELLACIGDRTAAWVESGVPGVRLLHFDGGAAVAGADCGLVEVQPGASFVPHVHRGDEWCLHLQGSGRDTSGEVREPGDLTHCGEGSSHDFTALEGEPYVFAVVLFGGFHPLAPEPTSEPTDGDR